MGASYVTVCRDLTYVTCKHEYIPNESYKIKRNVLEQWKSKKVAQFDFHFK